ncbi:zf-TFIIB domain-containing protein [Myxococcaceae bacterium GXIMD 01537]
MPTRRCPSCAQPMQTLFVERVELDRCLRCKATWFDGGELERVSGKQGAPTMTRPQPACRCPGCAGDLWFASLRGCEALACVGCGGCFVTDAQLQRAEKVRPASVPRPAMQFVCVGCKDRYAVNTGQPVAAGLACQRCAPRLPPPPAPPASTSESASTVQEQVLEGALGLLMLVLSI